MKMKIESKRTLQYAGAVKYKQKVDAAVKAVTTGGKTYAEAVKQGGRHGVSRSTIYRHKKAMQTNAPAIGEAKRIFTDAMESELLRFIKGYQDSRIVGATIDPSG
jgi:transposase